MTPRRSPSAVAGAVTTGPVKTDSTQQIPPVGQHPDVDVMFVSALMWSSPTTAPRVLALVDDGDVENPSLAVVLAAIRTLAGAGKPFGPQLVLDELRRTGTLNGHVAEQLRAATTCGAVPAATRHYAAALVAESLRRRVESAGHALTTMAAEAAEADIAPLVARAAESVSGCATRLAALRGEQR